MILRSDLGCRSNLMAEGWIQLGLYSFWDPNKHPCITVQHTSMPHFPACGWVKVFPTSQGCYEYTSVYCFHILWYHSYGGEGDKSCDNIWQVTWVIRQRSHHYPASVLWRLHPLSAIPRLVVTNIRLLKESNRKRGQSKLTGAAFRTKDTLMYQQERKRQRREVDSNSNLFSKI